MFEKHFENVYWETKYYTRRPEHDGTIDIPNYDVQEDDFQTKHTKIIISITDKDYGEKGEFYNYNWDDQERGIYWLNT